MLQQTGVKSSYGVQYTVNTVMALFVYTVELNTVYDVFNVYCCKTL